MKIAAPLTALALLAAAGTARADEPPKPAKGGNLATDVAGNPVSEGDTPAVVHYPPPITRLGVIGIGLLISGGAWGAAFGSATAWPLVPGSAQLKIPVAGPWIALGKSGCASDDQGCSAGTIGVRGALYVLDGIAQIAGLALIAEGIVMKTESKPDKKASAFPSLRVGNVEMTALPVATPMMHGLGVVGTF
jgi:hypothetical protein